MNLTHKNQQISVLITRPIETALTLAKEIEKHSARFKPIIFPAIEIKDSIDRQKTQSVFHQLSFNDYDLIIFISPTAVEKFAKLAKTYHYNFPFNIPHFCVGKDTASVIEKKLFTQAIFPEEKYNSEALLKLNALQEVAGKKILICQGKGGNPLIQESLSQRGADITPLVLYERTAPKPAKLPDLNSIDLIICTSQESLRNLMSLFQEPLKNKLFLFSSEKLKAQGIQLGLKYPPILVKHAGNEAILEALKDLDLEKGNADARKYTT
jgi:uroporphyrinogen-III synthase